MKNLRHGFFVIFLVLSGIFPAANAHAAYEGVFGRAVDDRYYLQGLHQSFSRRGWTVQAADKESITGYLSHRGVEATLKVYRDGDVYRYICDCKRTRKASHERDAEYIWEEYYPKKWVINLQRDVVKYSSKAKMQAERSASHAAQRKKSSAEAKISLLKEMRDDGILSESEYQAKKAMLKHGA